MAGYTPIPDTTPEPTGRPKATWRCSSCKERMLVAVTRNPADLYAPATAGLLECDMCGSDQLRGPYFPLDVPYRLYEEAYRALANQSTTVRKRILRLLRDEVRHVLDDHGLEHGRCITCTGLAIPTAQDAYECLECGLISAELAPAPVATRRPANWQPLTTR